MTRSTPDCADRAADTPLWQVSLVVVIGLLLTQMDAAMVNVALPILSHEFGATLATAQWIVTGYLLALSFALPLSGWMVDRWGAKRMYILCFAIFTLASLLCAMVRSIEALIAAKIFQGLAGGLLAPMAQMMMARAAGPRMATVMGWIAMPVLIAPMIGPSIGAFLISYGSVQWLFLVNVPIGILAIVLAWRMLPATRPLLPGTPMRQLDWIGFLLLSPGLALILVGLNQIREMVGIICLGAGVSLVALFIVHARRHGAQALINLALFGNRTFANAAMVQFASAGTNLAGQCLMPLLLIIGFRIAPLAAGWMLAMTGVGMLITYPVLGKLTHRFGTKRVALSGASLVALGLLPLIWMQYNGFSPMLLVMCLFVRGMGQSMIGVPTVAAAYASLTGSDIPNGTTAVNILQRFGGPVMITILGIALPLTKGIPDGPDPGLFLPSLLLMLGFSLIAPFFILRLRKSKASAQPF